MLQARQVRIPSYGIRSVNHRVAMRKNDRSPPSHGASQCNDDHYRGNALQNHCSAHRQILGNGTPREVLRPSLCPTDSDPVPASPRQTGHPVTAPTPTPSQPPRLAQHQPTPTRRKAAGTKSRVAKNRSRIKDKPDAVGSASRIVPSDPSDSVAEANNAQNERGAAGRRDPTDASDAMRPHSSAHQVPDSKDPFLVGKSGRPNEAPSVHMPWTDADVPVALKA